MLPTAPIPVHTAYAVPKGSDRSASDINAKRSAIATTVAMVGQNLVRPSEYFSPSAQATSNSPAARSAAQALIAVLAPKQVPTDPTRVPRIKPVDECAWRDARPRQVPRFHHRFRKNGPALA